MNSKDKALPLICAGAAALALLVAMSAPHSGQEPAPLPTVRPVSTIIQEHRVLPPPNPVPTPVGEEPANVEPANVEPDSTTPAEIAFEPQKPNATTEILTTNEPPRDKPTPELSPPQITATVTPAEPKMVDTQTVDGQKQVYFLGFGWIEDNDTPNECTYVEDMYENGNKVGTMGGGEVGRNCGDINKMVGTMD